MSSPYIKCSKCNELSSSQDYWVCPACGYNESRESVLLEENKDYSENRRKRNEVREAEERKWIDDQERLTKNIMKDLLPKSNYNWELRFISYTVNFSGRTYYHENEPLEIQKFLDQHNLTVYPYYADSSPTEIIIPRETLLKEDYSFNGEGFPAAVIPHEAAHADPAVKKASSFPIF